MYLRTNGSQRIFKKMEEAMKLFFGLNPQKLYFYYSVPAFYNYLWAEEKRGIDHAFKSTRFHYKLSSLELGTILNGLKKL